ncbi:MAG: hypothetical protein QM656_02490 [Paracoccaceae bacterium]
MPTDQDRHTRTPAAPAQFHAARSRSFHDRDVDELADLLVQHRGERAAHYVPLPRLIQE